MLVTKSVSVHADTHNVLKAIKEKNRNKSMDEVIRSLIKVGHREERRGALCPPEQHQAPIFRRVTHLPRGAAHKRQK